MTDQPSVPDDERGLVATDTNDVARGTEDTDPESLAGDFIEEASA